MHPANTRPMARLSVFTALGTLLKLSMKSSCHQQLLQQHLLLYNVTVNHDQCCFHISCSLRTSMQLHLSKQCLHNIQCLLVNHARQE